LQNEFFQEIPDISYVKDMPYKKIQLLAFSLLISIYTAEWQI